MARKYRPRRLYPARRYAQAEQQGGGFGEGWRIGGMIGGGLGELTKAIAAAREKAARDRVANRILNTAYAPRAGFAGGTAPGAGVPLAGTAPETGGSAALDEAIRGQQLMASLQRQQIEAQQQKTAAETLALRRRAIEAGGGRGRSPWRPGGGTSAAPVLSQGGRQAPGGKPGKPTKYEPNSSTPDQAAYYNYNTHRADVDARYGKGTFDRLQAAAGGVSKNPDTGKYEVAPEYADTVAVHPDTGEVTLLPKGSYPGAKISGEEVQSNMARYDATTVKRGGKPSYVDHYMGSAAPQSGLAAGTQENPYTPKSAVELNAIPEGQWYVNPQTGKTHQAGPVGPPPEPSEEKKTTALGGGEEGGRLAATAAPPIAPGPVGATAPAPIAPGAPTAPAPVDLRQSLVGGQDTELADAIARARAAESLQGPTPTPTPFQGPTPPIDIASIAPGNVPESFSLGQLPTGGGMPDTQLADAIRMAQMSERFA